MHKILIMMMTAAFVLIVGCSPRVEELMESTITVAVTTTTKEVDDIKEIPIDQTTPENNEVETEPNLEEEIFNIFLDYLESAKNDEEYDYFSSQTKGIVGSESEYLSGAKTDIYYIVKEAHQTLEDIKLKSIVLHEGRAFLTITADRVVEGMEYDDEEISWKFIMEEDWKIDFYYPIGILVMLNSPDPFETNMLNDHSLLEVDANIMSFFEITEIGLYVNSEEIDLEISEIDDFEKDIFVSVSEGYLISGLNDIEIKVRNIIGEEEFYLDIFTVN